MPTAVTHSNGRVTGFRSMSVRPEDLEEAKQEIDRLRLRQADFLGVLLRAWKSMRPEKQLSFIPKSTDGD